MCIWVGNLYSFALYALTGGSRGFNHVHRKECVLTQVPSVLVLTRCTRSLFVSPLGYYFFCRGFFPPGFGSARFYWCPFNDRWQRGFITDMHPSGSLAMRRELNYFYTKLDNNVEFNDDDEVIVFTITESNRVEKPVLSWLNHHNLSRLCWKIYFHPHIS